MARRGAEAERYWDALTPTPLYEEMTLWVMATWPEEAIEHVDTMVRTAIASATRVRQGDWSTERLVGVVRKAGRRSERRAVHRHLGQAVRIVSFDDALVELAEESATPTFDARPLGEVIVSHLCQALGEHRYMVTPAAAALLDRSCDIAVDHLDSVRARTVSPKCPEGLSGLDLFAAARPTRNANKLNRITVMFKDLPHPTGVSLAHLLLGTDHHPEAALLWRHASRLPPTEVPPEVVTDWRAELVALTPTTLELSDRRRRRLRDRSRKGDNLRRYFESSVDGALGNRGVSVQT